MQFLIHERTQISKLGSELVLELRKIENLANDEYFMVKSFYKILSTNS